MIAALILCGPLLGDEPRNRFQIVTPKPDGINAVGINGHGDIIGFEWIESKKIPGVVEELPFFARGKTVTWLPLLKTYTATFPAAVSDDGTVVGRSSKPAPRGVVIPLRNQAFVWTAAGGIRGLGALEEDMASFATDITRDGRRISGFSVGDQPGSRLHLGSRRRRLEGHRPALRLQPRLERRCHERQRQVPLRRGWREARALDRACRTASGSRSSSEFRARSSRAGSTTRAWSSACVSRSMRLTHAVIWSRETGLKQLEKPQGYVRSEALAVNNQGIVVGMVDGPRGFERSGPTRSSTNRAGSACWTREGRRSPRPKRSTITGRSPASSRRRKTRSTPRTRQGEKAERMT